MRENKAVMNKKYTILISILVAIIIVSITITIWLLVNRSVQPVISPDYPPQELEANAKQMKEADDSKLEAPTGGGAVSLNYSSNVEIDLSKNIATLMFANPSKSTQDMMLQIVIQGSVVAESGRLTPGNKVECLAVGEYAKLPSGKYDGEFVISFYDMETGEKAMVNSTIGINIEVKE